MKSAFLFILLLFLVTSCFRVEDDIISKNCPGSCTIITGKITTGNGSVPFKKLSLSLECRPNPRQFGGLIRRKATARTDAQGFYTLKFLVRDDEIAEGHYQVNGEFDTDVYLNFNKEDKLFSFYNLKRDTTIEMNYWLPKKAFIEMKLANPEDIKSGDTFYSVMGSKLGVDGAQYYSNYVNWTNPPTSSVLEVAAEQPIFVEHWKLKNNVRITERDTLQLKAGEKVIYTTRF
jgi:hypothetical protein